jgi:hypothetical protein
MRKRRPAWSCSISVDRKHVVQRRDIASLESSNQSIMPVGLESMGEADLAAVLAYLATSVEGPAKK